MATRRAAVKSKSGPKILFVKFNNEYHAPVNPLAFNKDFSSKTFEYPEMTDELCESLSMWTFDKGRDTISDYDALAKLFEAMGAKSFVFNEMKKYVPDGNKSVASQIISDNTENTEFKKSNLVRELGMIEECSLRFNNRKPVPFDYWSDTYDYIHDAHDLQKWNFERVAKIIKTDILVIGNHEGPGDIVGRHNFVKTYKSFLGEIFTPKIFDKFADTFTITGGYVTGMLLGKIDPKSDIDIFIIGNNHRKREMFLKLFLDHIKAVFQYEIFAIGKSIADIKLRSKPSYPDSNDKVYPDIQIIMSTKRNPVEVIHGFDLTHVRAFLAFPCHDGAPTCYVSSFGALSMLTGVSYCMKSLVYPKRMCKAYDKGFSIAFSPFVDFVYVNGDSRLYKPGAIMDIESVRKIQQYNPGEGELIKNFDEMVPNRNLGYMNVTLQLSESLGHNSFEGVAEVFREINKMVDTKIASYIDKSKSKERNRNRSYIKNYSRKIENVRDIIDKKYPAYKNIVIAGSESYIAAAEAVLGPYIKHRYSGGTDSENNCRPNKLILFPLIRDSTMIKMGITDPATAEYLNIAIQCDGIQGMPITADLTAQYKWLINNKPATETAVALQREIIAHEFAEIQEKRRKQRAKHAAREAERASESEEEEESEDESEEETVTRRSSSPQRRAPRVKTIVPARHKTREEDSDDE